MDSEHVGERLRAIRRQKGCRCTTSRRAPTWSSRRRCSAPTSAVSARSPCRGSLRLAEIYGCRPTSCCPRRRSTSRSTSPSRSAIGAVDGLHDRPRAPARDRRPRRRGASRGTRRRSSSSARTSTAGCSRSAATTCGCSPRCMGRSLDELGVRLDQLGLRAGAPEQYADIRPERRRRARYASAAPWPAPSRPPRSRSSSRATTSWWACSVNATSCCAWSRTRSPSRSTCAATRSPSPATSADAERVGRLFEELVVLLEQGHELDRDGVGRSHRDGEGRRAPDRGAHHRGACAGARRSGRRPRGRSATSTPSATHTVTFGIGPAGTGKSYLAVALAVQALQAKEVNRIILTRPAVEAGERLGFLPGDLLAKVDPYLRPLYDALYDMLEPEVVARLMERGTIEVAPLAFMRGRTLNDSFIILDEAQNTTPEQMKMFLTRLGFGSKVVVTGDVTQIDLPDGRGRSGLLAGARRSSTASTASRSSSSARGDVVRHRIVQDIVDAYERHETLSDDAMSDDRAPSVFVADEQHDVAGRRAALGRGSRGSCSTTRASRRSGPTPSCRCSSSTRTTIAELNERFLGDDGPTDVLAFPIDDDLLPSGRQPDQGGRGPGRADRAGRPAARCSATSWSARRSRARQAPEHAGTARRRARAARRARRAAPARLRPRRRTRGRVDADAGSASCSERFRRARRLRRGAERS